MMKNDILKLLLVGIGGYGGTYAGPLLDKGAERGMEISGIVDPAPEGFIRYEEIKERGIPIYKNMSDFYKAGNAELAVISSPIQFHSDQIAQALSNGSNVLCEKPMCATIGEGEDIIKKASASGKLVSIGFQWSFSDAILSLKKDINSGLLGAPIELKTLVLWPRPLSYYARNSWAGRINDPQGRPVYDSVANNATAHYLHNMFFVLDADSDGASKPESVYAELYKANDIESFDTCAIRCKSAMGADILFIASHAVDVSRGPEFIYRFENATVSYNASEGLITADLGGGKTKCYGNPGADDLKKLWDTADAIRSGGKSKCPPKAAMPHIVCIDTAHKACRKIIPFAADLVGECDMFNNQKGRFVTGLFDSLLECYVKGIVPFEAGFGWSRQGSEAKP